MSPYIPPMPPLMPLLCPHASSCGHFMSLVCPLLCPLPTVADPGFSQGGGANLPRGSQHTISPNFPKNCMKLKEFGPRGGHTSLVPPLDLPLPYAPSCPCIPPYAPTYASIPSSMLPLRIPHMSHALLYVPSFFPISSPICCLPMPPPLLPCSSYALYMPLANPKPIYPYTLPMPP